MKKSSEAVLLTRAEVDQIASSIKKERDKIIFKIFSETGASLKEVVEIKKKDIDYKDNNILVPASNTKHNRKRIIKIDAKLTRAILLYTKKNTNKTYLFESRQSTKITERRIQQIIATHSQKTIMKKVSPHDLRTSYIIHSFLDQKPIEEIEEQVGINNIQPYIYSYFKK